MLDRGYAEFHHSSLPQHKAPLLHHTSCRAQEQRTEEADPALAAAAKAAQLCPEAGWVQPALKH
jgi:hypothetical protein